MKALGRRQISLMRTMLEKGDGNWPRDFRIYSGNRVILDKLVDRGLLDWSLEVPGGYSINERGRQALQMRGLI